MDKLMEYFEDKDRALTDDIDELKAILAIAEAGNADAQFELGCRFEEGECGLAVNFDEAVKWYKRAVKGDDRDACYALGRFYDSGIVVRQDYKEALRLFKLAFEDDFMTAGFLIGRYYEEGLGVKQDKKIARHWFDKASKGSGFTIAEGRAQVFIDGHGVECDDEEIIIRSEEIADNGRK